MFDIFGIKAKRRVAELEVLVNEQDKRLIEYARICGASAAKVSALEGQIAAVRRLATEMRDRVHSHGATGAERNFLDVCQNIHAHGKMISTMRFHHMLEVAKKERDSLTQAVGAGQ